MNLKELSHKSNRFIVSGHAGSLATSNYHAVAFMVLFMFNWTRFNMSEGVEMVKDYCLQQQRCPLLYMEQQPLTDDHLYLVHPSQTSQIIHPVYHSLINFRPLN